MFPPGRAMLATTPRATGSKLVAMMTTGKVLVALMTDFRVMWVFQDNDSPHCAEPVPAPPHQSDQDGRVR